MKSKVRMLSGILGAYKYARLVRRDIFIAYTEIDKEILLNRYQETMEAIDAIEVSMSDKKGLIKLLSRWVVKILTGTMLEIKTFLEDEVHPDPFKKE